MIISIDAKKALDKIQHLYIIKSLSKIGIEVNFLNMIKGLCEKRIPNTK